MQKLILTLFFVGLSVTSALATPITPDPITINWGGPGFFHDAELQFQSPFLSSQLDVDDTSRWPWDQAFFGSLRQSARMNVDLRLNEVWTTVYTTDRFLYMQDIPSMTYMSASVSGIRFTSHPDDSITGFGNFDSSLRFTFSNKAIPTPEPSATLLLGIGLLSLSGYRHWRQKQHQMV